MLWPKKLGVVERGEVQVSNWVKSDAISWWKPGKKGSNRVGSRERFGEWGCTNLKNIPWPPRGVHDVTVPSCFKWFESEIERKQQKNELHWVLERCSEKRTSFFRNSFWVEYTYRPRPIYICQVKYIILFGSFWADWRIESTHFSQCFKADMYLFKDQHPINFTFRIQVGKSVNPRRVALHCNCCLPSKGWNNGFTLAEDVCLSVSASRNLCLDNFMKPSNEWVLQTEELQQHGKTLNLKNPHLFFWQNMEKIMRLQKLNGTSTKFSLLFFNKPYMKLIETWIPGPGVVSTWRPRRPQNLGWDASNIGVK